MSVRGVLGALQASAATTVECELSRDSAWRGFRARTGGATRSRHPARRSWTPIRRGRFRCTRRRRELRVAWEPSTAARRPRAMLLHIANAATLHRVRARTWPRSTGDALARRWDATLAATWPDRAGGFECAGPGAQAGEHHAGGHRPDRPRARPRHGHWPRPGPGVGQQSAWTRPTCSSSSPSSCLRKTRQMNPEEAQELAAGPSRRSAVAVGLVRWCAWRHRSGRRCTRRCAASWTGEVSTHVRASRGTPPPRNCRWRSVWFAHAQAQGAPACQRAGAARLGADSRNFARHWPAARASRASTARRAGCGWTRPPPYGTRLPLPAPWK